MKEEIRKAREAVKNGGLIIYPTDTIWGLGCDATNENAVDRIFEIKERDPSKSLILLVSSDGMLERFVKNVPEVAWDLIDCSEKPITIVYSQGVGLANKTMADDGSIGIRVIREGFAHQLIHNLNRPIVSTSANISGDPSPASFSEISEELKSRVDYIVNLPSEEGEGKASSIIKLGVNGEIEIIRK